MFAKADAADAVSAFCVMSNNYGGSDMIKVIGFDIGGTLMEYKNMPNVWIDYYKTGFETVRDRLGLHISDDDIARSVEVLILITNKTIDKKSSHNPYTQDYAQFFV